MSDEGNDGGYDGRDLARPRLLNINDPGVRREFDRAGTDPLETQVMRLFAQEYRGRFLFNVDTGKWMHWNGVIWAEDWGAVADTAMFDLCEAVRLQDERRRASMGKVGFVRNALTGVSRLTEMRVRQAEFDKDPDLMGIPDGYVDLRTGEIKDPDPSKMISKSTAVNPVKGVPKMWIDFLMFATGGDLQVIEYLQKYFGYCLSGRVNEEIMTFLYGPGGNGKGVMINAACHVMKDYYASTPSSTFMDTHHREHSTELAGLDGARFVTASETGSDDKWNLARIKEITGAENPIRARFMRQDFFSFWPVCKLLVVGNNKPQIGEVDAAIARRLRMIEFTKVPDQADVTLKDRMQQEYGEILQWMIEGFQKYLEEGLEAPDAVRKASSAYLASEDLAADFIDQALEFRSKGRLLRKDLGWALKVFTKQNGHTRAVKANRIYKRLEEAYGLSRDDWYRQVRAFHGVNIKPEFWKIMISTMDEGQEPPEADGLTGVTEAARGG